MSIRLSVIAMAAVMIAGMGVSPIFGQIDPIVITTDKDSYVFGDTIMVTGEVRDSLSGVPVTLKVITANGNIAGLEQLEIRDDKTFAVDLFAGSILWSSKGTYTIMATYGIGTPVTAQTTFEFGGAIQDDTTPYDTSISIEGFDGAIGYTITGGSLKSITPNPESTSLIIGIEAINDGMLDIGLPRAVIDSRTSECAGSTSSFIVLVDSEEVDFIETAGEDIRNLSVEFYAGATEIEIIGTCVIPEFGTIAVLVLAVAIVSIIAVSARSRLSIMPKY